MIKNWQEIEKVKVSEQEKTKILNSVLEQRNKKKPIANRLIPLVTSFALIAVGWFAIRINLVSTSAVIGSVALDTSSMIVVEVNSAGMVSEIKSSSTLDQEVLDELQLTGKNLEDAIILVIEITANPQQNLNIYVYSENQTDMDMIENVVEQAVSQTNHGLDHCRTEQLNSSEWENLLESHNGDGEHHRRKSH
ncbi:MAG: hypothetical protein ACK5LZ_03150 [Anaerorhabdus sp.]